jgi:DNA modification methylase
MISIAGDRIKRISLTGGNIRNCHISVTRLRDLLPSDCFGAANTKNGAGRPVLIHLEGLNNTIETDVGRDAKTGRPRSHFRERGGMRKFFDLHNAKAGDVVEVERMGDREYRLRFVNDRDAPVIDCRKQGSASQVILEVMDEQPVFPFISAVKANGNGSAFKDPAFMENRKAPVHRWVPWIAGFSGAFVDSVLAAYLGHRKSALVLDPFAGVGTTLIQSAIRGHNVVGFEINPYAALAAEAKLKALRVKTEIFDSAIEAMRLDARSWRNGRVATAVAPQAFQSRIPFYSENVKNQVLHALAFTSTIRDTRVRKLFQIAFGSVMVSFSNYTYEPSLSTREGAGKPLIEDADVAATLLEKLRNMRADIEWLRSEAIKTRPGNGKVYSEDFFTGNQRVESGSVDLMLTSPPYLNNYHYARNTRPQLYWLGLISSPQEQRPLEERNFGTFWQIAREKDNIPLALEHGGLQRILTRLRKLNPEKRQYGGRGWANYAASYFNDCDRFLKVLKRVLAPGGTGVIVVGNSILQGVNVPVQHLIGDIAKMHGLAVEGIYRLRNKRVGNSITASSVRSGTSKATLNESAVVIHRE